MSNKKVNREKGVLALIILSLVFASMGIFVRYLQFDFTILQQTYLRIFAAFIIGIIVFYKDIHFYKLVLISKKEWLLLLLRSLTIYVIGVTLLSQAYITTLYSNVSFIGALPLTAIFGFLLLKEKLTSQKILYVLVGFIGVVIIAVKDYSHLLSWGQGEVFTLIATVSFAISYISRKWQGDLLNNKEIAVLIFLISSILLFLTSLFFRETLPHLTSFSITTILLIIIAGTFNVANLFLTNYGFEKIEAVLAGNILMLEVVFAVIIGYVFFREIPSLKDVIGGVLIILSAYMINKLS
jgi:drug/metabolite transporter (DMT)-like permease